MALLYAKPTEHAIRALIYLAVQEEPRLVAVQEIAESEGISGHHLSKVMKTLAQKKILNSIRGPGGGYRLNKDPEEISMWDLVECFGAHGEFAECALGWTECHDDHPCPLHDRWVELRERNQRYLEGMTIAHLAVAALEKPEHTSPKPTHC